MFKRVALSVFVLVGFASGAFAQTQRSQQQSVTQLSAISPGAPMYDSLNIQAKLWRQSMTDNPQPDVRPDQWRRARQAVALIKANHCEDAYNLALAEQDDRLALNIAVACKARLRE